MGYMEKRFTLYEYSLYDDTPMKRIYISGPVSMFAYSKAKERFDNAQKRLNSAGFYVLENPMSFCCRSWDYERCMRTCINRLIHCDAIYMQRLWWLSRGARLERRNAIAFGMDIIYE